MLSKDQVWKISFFFHTNRPKTLLCRLGKDDTFSILFKTAQEPWLTQSRVDNLVLFTWISKQKILNKLVSKRVDDSVAAGRKHHQCTLKVAERTIATWNACKYCQAMRHS